MIFLKDYKNLKMKKAIIFDLYDTLITVHDKTDPYIYLLSTLRNKGGIKGKKPPFSQKDVINTIITDDYNTDELELYFDLDIDKEYFHSLLRKEIDSVQAMKGIYRTLTKLSEKYRLFLLSNLSTPYKSPYYTLSLNHYFEKAFFSCDEGDRKPNASFFQKVVNYSKLEKKDFVMIGDSKFSDIQGAEKFGIDSIYRGPNSSLEVLTKELC